MNGLISLDQKYDPESIKNYWIKRTRKELKGRIFSSILNQYGVFFCANCGRTITDQQISVSRIDNNVGEYICICQLWKYCKGNHIIRVKGKPIDYRTLIYK